ncbi:MAG: nucleotide excision repair endonuclease [Polyangiaceae bacterium]|nr:nucleotide excision repair endonuclease [Polyangiaceae bacterium]
MPAFARLSLSQAQFDKKFGDDFCQRLPTSPGIYRFYDARGELIYVGKAKNLRQRLQSYRNAGRKKKEKKQRLLTKEAQRIEFEVLASEEEALLTEARLIQEKKPTYNIQCAYDFLYPAIGCGSWDAHLLLSFSNQPAPFSSLNLSWFGVFRSRPRAKLAFTSLEFLLAHLGHQEQRNRLPQVQNPRGSRLIGFRQLPTSIQETLPWYLAGTEADLLSELAHHLLRKPAARRRAEEVQMHLTQLKHFYQTDTQQLRRELQATGRPGSFVASTERDQLHIRANFAK